MILAPYIFSKLLFCRCYIGFMLLNIKLEDLLCFFSERFSFENTLHLSPLGTHEEGSWIYGAQKHIKHMVLYQVCPIVQMPIGVSNEA